MQIMELFLFFQSDDFLLNYEKNFKNKKSSTNNLYSRSTFGTSPKGRFLVNGTSPKGDLGLDIWTQKLAGTRPI